VSSEHKLHLFQGPPTKSDTRTKIIESPNKEFYDVRDEGQRRSDFIHVR
jgi:hypothetical protein